MSTSSQQHIDTIRTNTAYASLRGLIDPISMLGMALAALTALGTVRSGFGAMRFSFFGGVGILVMGLLSSALIFFVARFFKEAATMAADVADSITETNARGESRPGSGA